MAGADRTPIDATRLDRAVRHGPQSRQTAGGQTGIRAAAPSRVIERSLHGPPASEGSSRHIGEAWATFDEVQRRMLASKYGQYLPFYAANLPFAKAPSLAKTSNVSMTSLDKPSPKMVCDDSVPGPFRLLSSIRTELPLRLVETQISPSWVDYNGHMTEHRYLEVFGYTTDALLRMIGVDLAYVATGYSYYTVETHIRHVGEARVGQAIYSTCQVLSVDEKRIHLFHTIADAASEKTLATAEHMLLHVDSKAGKASLAPPDVLDRIQAIAAAHASLSTPVVVGRHVGQKN